jgi:hypothetical protein
MCLHETVDLCFFHTLLFIIVIILIRRIGDTGNQCGWKILVDCLKNVLLPCGMRGGDERMQERWNQQIKY